MKVNFVSSDKTDHELKEFLEKSKTSYIYFMSMEPGVAQEWVERKETEKVVNKNPRIRHPVQHNIDEAKEIFEYTDVQNSRK